MWTVVSDSMVYKRTVPVWNWSMFCCIGPSPVIGCCCCWRCNTGVNRRWSASDDDDNKFCCWSICIIIIIIITPPSNYIMIWKPTTSSCISVLPNSAVTVFNLVFSLCTLYDCCNASRSVFSIGGTKYPHCNCNCNCNCNMTQLGLVV